MGGIRDAKHPNQASLWESKIQLGERFFHEIITNPLPIEAGEGVRGRGLPDFDRWRTIAPTQLHLVE